VLFFVVVGGVLFVDGCSLMMFFRNVFVKGFLFLSYWCRRRYVVELFFFFFGALFFPFEATATRLRLAGRWLVVKIL
jgi:hypothetical protein